MQDQLQGLAGGARAEGEYYVRGRETLAASLARARKRISVVVVVGQHPAGGCVSQAAAEARSGGEGIPGAAAHRRSRLPRRL